MSQWQSLLVPPGAGVYTVSSGSNFKKNLWQNYYQTFDETQVSALWQKQLTSLSKLNHAKLITNLPLSDHL